ncbi:MAG: hypothetical protein ACREDX_03570 [Aestuariivirga sp.]
MQITFCADTIGRFFDLLVFHEVAASVAERLDGGQAIGIVRGLGMAEGGSGPRKDGRAPGY